MLIGPDLVTQAVAEAAQAEILPRFHNLSPSDIRQKTGPLDLVTVADEVMEKRLSETLIDMLPGSIAVGEEAAAADPAVLRRLNGEAPCWVIDPVDGTSNFANGVSCFAVIVALCQGAETVQGWIHDPVNSITQWAVKGEGAFEDGEPLRLPRAPSSIEAMRGRLPETLARKFSARLDAGETGLPRDIVNLRCAGREYMALSRGDLHFCRYGGKLKPWDHAAGLLIHSEAGGRHGMMPDGVPYLPSGPRPGPLVIAMSRDHWHTMAPLIGSFRA